MHWVLAFQEVTKHLPASGKEGINSFIKLCLSPQLVFHLVNCHYLYSRVFLLFFYFLTVLQEKGVNRQLCGHSAVGRGQSTIIIGIVS